MQRLIQLPAMAAQQ